MTTACFLNLQLSSFIDRCNFFHICRSIPCFCSFCIPWFFRAIFFFCALNGISNLHDWWIKLLIINTKSFYRIIVGSISRFFVCYTFWYLIWNIFQLNGYRINRCYCINCFFKFSVIISVDSDINRITSCIYTFWDLSWPAWFLFLFGYTVFHHYIFIIRIGSFHGFYQSMVFSIICTLVFICLWLKHCRIRLFKRFIILSFHTYCHRISSGILNLWNRLGFLTGTKLISNIISFSSTGYRYSIIFWKFLTFLCSGIGLIQRCNCIIRYFT